MNEKTLTREERAEIIKFYGPLFEKALDNIGQGTVEPDFTVMCECYGLKRQAPMSMMLCGFLAGVSMGADIAEFFIQKGGSNHE